MERLPAQGLFLDLLVDVQRPDRLMKHYDVENYLTPLAGRLGWQRFVMAVGRKRVGGGSRLSVGIARASPPESRKFVTAVVDAGSGSTTGQWKSRLRDSVAALEMPMLPPGPVALELSWRCSPALNWVALWKPTGDAMGSILGEPDSRNPFNVADDRIVSLTLHRDIDPAMGRGVHVGFFLPRSR